MIRTLHRWSGALLALLLIVIGLTGALSVFRGDLPRLQYAAARGAPADQAAFGAALARFEADSGAAIRSVKFAPYELGVHRVYLESGGGAFIDRDGKQVDGWRGGGRPEDVILNLHHKLLAGERGETVVGLIGVAGMGLVVSGLWLWWPARRGFALRLWPRSWSRLSLVASHRNLGILIALPLALQFATGVAMVFEKPLARAIGVADKLPAAAPDAGAADWPAIVAGAAAAYPDGRVRIAAAPRGPGGTFNVRLQRPGDLNPEGSTVVALDGTGRVLARYDAAAVGAGQRFLDAALGLHAGDWGGLASRLLVAATGAGLAFTALIAGLAFLKGWRLTAR